VRSEGGGVRTTVREMRVSGVRGAVHVTHIRAQAEALLGCLETGGTATTASVSKQLRAHVPACARLCVCHVSDSAAASAVRLTNRPRAPQRHYHPPLLPR
jgi:hypothetical protein